MWPAGPREGPVPTVGALGLGGSRQLQTLQGPQSFPIWPGSATWTHLLEHLLCAWLCLCPRLCLCPHSAQTTLAHSRFLGGHG